MVHRLPDYLRTDGARIMRYIPFPRILALRGIRLMLDMNNGHQTNFLPQ